MNTQIGKWGNSLAVRIPGAYAKDLDLKEGSEVDVSLVKGALVVRPPSGRTYSLAELVAAITPENLHGETDWGEAVGRESW
jgi:antitoxin MazE